MQDVFRYTGLTLSVGLLISALYFFYAQPKFINTFFSNSPALYGLQTNFELSQVPMKNQSNDEVFWQDYNQTPLFVTAGFTSCVKSCPVTLAFYRELAKQIKTPINFAFLTIDPEIDSTERLATYLGNINPDFIGLRVEQPHLLDQVISELKQSVFKTGNENDFIHKGFIYLIHPEHKGLIIYQDYQMDIQSMINDLKVLSS